MKDDVRLTKMEKREKKAKKAFDEWNLKLGSDVVDQLWNKETK